MKDSFSYYDILGIPSKASDNDIKRAYLELAKKYHPDQNPQNPKLASHRFKVIVEAYDAIKTREKRADYNRKLRTMAENDNTQTTHSIFSQIGDLFRTNKREQKETQK